MNKRKIVGVAVVVVLSVVGYFFGGEAVTFVRDAVGTAQVNSGS